MRLLAASFLLLAGCSSASGPMLPTVEVRFALEPPIVVAAEVADEPLERARGLMFRERLGANEGMLFLFSPPPARRSFYMKDTLIPLDLISIRDGRVVGVQQMVPCETMVCPTTRTPEADAALEVAAGTAARAGIGPGVRVVWGAVPNPG